MTNRVMRILSKIREIFPARFLGFKNRNVNGNREVNGGSIQEDTINKQISLHWSSKAGETGPKRIRWWESPLIRRHYNRTVSGFEDEGLPAVAQRIANGRVFNEGVSVGCGTGWKEMELIQRGLVKYFHLFELSDVRIKQGLELARRLNMEDRVVFRSDDCFKSFNDNSVDFVHWNNSLHHMMDVDRAVHWSHAILREDGMFYLDDFVGPSLFQWSDKSLSLANRIRSVLPDRYLVSPYHPGEKGVLLSRTLTRPNPDKLRKRDPSEAVQSDLIIGCVKKYFPGVKITFTGGVVYSLGLEDVIHNVDEENEYDRVILNLLMMMDELCTGNRDYESLYATAIAIKKKRY